MNTNQIPELLSYEEAKEQLRENGCGWRAANILLAGAESYLANPHLANPRWPDADVQPARVWRAILESHVRHKEAERAERNSQPCPERVPCPHTIGEHRGVKGGLGCSVEECPCNVQYVFALNGKDGIRFRADFTGTDKIAGEEHWQAFPLTVELAGIGVDIGHDGAANGEEEERHFIQIDASRFFKLAAAFVDCVRAGAEQRRLADVRAIRNHKDAETWIKRVSLAHAVEGILTLKTDADMALQSVEPWTFERLAEIPFVRRWMVDFMAVAVRDTLCAQRLEELLLLHRQVRDVSPYRTQEEDDTAGSALARAKTLGLVEQDTALPAREKIPPMPAELNPAPSNLASVMHDANTHPRRHDPISLGEEGPWQDHAPSRLVRTSGVLTIDLGINETIPAAVLDHRTEAETHQDPSSELACPGFGPGAKGPRCCDLAGEPIDFNRCAIKCRCHISADAARRTLVHCKICHKDHCVLPDEKPCAPGAWGTFEPLAEKDQ